MNYKEVFIVNKPENKSYENIPENFILENYNQYGAKLDSEFYLKYFLHKASIEIDILELNDFFQFHYDNCLSPDNFLKVLNLKLIPKMFQISETKEFNMVTQLNNDEIELENNFYSFNGIVFNRTYEVDSIVNNIILNKTSFEFFERKKILEAFIKEIESSYKTNNESPIKWIAGPAQLGYIISQLVAKKYIEAPINTMGKSKGDINNSQLAKDILKAFYMPSHKSVESLKLYLNPNNYKNVEIGKHFDHNGFNLPYNDKNSE